MPDLPFTPDVAESWGLRYWDPGLEDVPAGVAESFKARAVAIPGLFRGPGVLADMTGIHDAGARSEVRGTVWMELATGRQEEAWDRPAVVLEGAEALEGKADVWICFRLADALAVRSAGFRSIYANDIGRLKVLRVVTSATACRILVVPGIPPRRRGDAPEVDAFVADLKQHGAEARAVWSDDTPYEVLRRSRPGALADWLAGEAEGPGDRPEYRWPTVAEGLAGWLESLYEPRPDAPRTGLDGLDALLGGGIRPGLYVLGAASSMGKTTLALQLADAAAAQGRHVLFFSCEQSAAELRAKSVARTLNEDGEEEPLEASEILYRASYLTAAQLGAVERAAERHAGRSERYWVIDNDDERDDDSRIGLDTVLGHVARLRAAVGDDPYLLVVVDYLQILYSEPPPLGRSPDRRLEIDEAVTVLRRLTRGSPTAVIVVSSKSRESIGKAVDMGGMKESGGIEYSADVLLELEPDPGECARRLDVRGSGGEPGELKGIPLFENARTLADRPMLLKVRKNRMGMTGAVRLEYHSRYDHFEERRAQVPRPPASPFEPEGYD